MPTVGSDPAALTVYRVPVDKHAIELNVMGKLFDGFFFSRSDLNDIKKSFDRRTELDSNKSKVVSAVDRKDRGLSFDV